MHFRYFPSGMFAKLSLCLNISSYEENMLQIDFVHEQDSQNSGIAKKFPSEDIQFLISILENYFSGEKINHSILWDRFKFSETIKTPFAQHVLAYVCTIPYGETRSYKDVGNALGSKAYRAIGSILAKNPIPILIPCHRVVSSAGIGGFMGKIDPFSWELQIKRSLIEWELINQ